MLASLMMRVAAMMMTGDEEFKGVHGRSKLDKEVRVFSNSPSYEDLTILSAFQNSKSNWGWR